MRQSQVGGYSGPRRARPGWMSDSVAPPVASFPINSPTTPQESAVIQPAVCEEVNTSPLARSVYPVGSDGESEVLRAHISLLCEFDLVSVSEMVKKIVSVVPGCELVGVWADGTAVRGDVVTVSIPGRPNSADIIAQLHACGMSVFRSGNCYDVLIGAKSIQIFLSSSHELFIKRAIFVKMYTHKIEPRMGVVVTLMRKWTDTPHTASYLFFVLLWKLLVQKKVIPNLLLKTSGPTCTQRWNTIQMIKALTEYLQGALCPENWMSNCVCPISGQLIWDEGVTVPYGTHRMVHDIWTIVCTLQLHV